MPLSTATTCNLLSRLHMDNKRIDSSGQRHNKTTSQQNRDLPVPAIVSSLASPPLVIMENKSSSPLPSSSSITTCTSQVELTLSCRNLRNADLLSKSDPYCVVFLKDPWQDQFYQLGRTETIRDCLAPEWVNKFVVEYNFETIQQIRFEVWDRDSNGKKDFLGLHLTTVADIVGYTPKQYVRSLKGFQESDTKKRGQIIIVSEEVSACKKIALVDFRAEGIHRYFFEMLRPNTFLVISRCNEDNSYSVVFKTKTVNSSTCPHWEPFQIRLRTLCNGDFERAIKLDVYKHHNNGNHKLIGTSFTTLSELVNHVDISNTEPFISRDTKVFRLVKLGAHPNSRSVTQPASLILNRISLSNEITFLDYIKSGTQMHFAVAIDFTASNGAPHDPRSLHYIDVFRPVQNPYEIALYSIGEIIAKYNTSGMYPAFGFGAKLTPDQEVSHLFPLNSNSAHPYCVNIAEIITHYRKCLTSVTLHGPTHFAPVISNTAQIASRFANGKHYFVLLIITDGQINDMLQTKRALINASSLPLSVIIVGVGSANFSEMDHLDSDDALLSVEGATAKRDIVQFVPLNKFLSPSVSGVRSQADLAREVLAEIPDQMTGYMRLKGFVPEKLQKDWI